MTAEIRHDLFRKVVGDDTSIEQLVGGFEFTRARSGTPANGI